MSLFLEKDGKKILPVTFYIKILIFCLMIGISTIAMRPIQAVVGDVMLKIRTEFIETLEKATGLNIYYSSMRPSFFGSVSIRELKFINKNASLFTVSRIRIDFSVTQLILNKNIVINKVIIERPEINIDMQRDKDALDYFSSLINKDDSSSGDDSGIIDGFFPKGVEYQIRRGNISITDNDIFAAAQNINLNIGKDDEEFFLDGDFSAEVRYSYFFNTIMLFNTAVYITCTSSANFDKGQADISTSFIRCSLQDVAGKEATFFNSPVNAGRPREMFTVVPFDFALSYKDKNFNMSNLTGNYSIEYELNYNIDTGNFLANAVLNEFLLSEKMNFSNQWKESDYFLDMKINGFLSLSYKNDINVFDYSVDITGQNMRNNASGGSSLVDAFAVKADGDNKKMHVDDLYFSSSNIRGLTSSGNGRLASSAQNYQHPSGGFFYGQIGFKGDIAFEHSVLPFAPQGTLFFDNFSLTGSDSLTSVCYISANRQEIAITSGNAKIAGTTLNDLFISLIPESGGIDIKVSCLNNEQGSINLDAFLNNSQNQGEISIFLHSVNPLGILELFKPFTNAVSIPDIYGYFLQNSSLDADIFITTDFNNIIYNVPNLTVYTENISGIISLSGTDRQFTVSDSIINIFNNEFVISAGMNFANPMDLIFSVNAGYMEYSWQLEGEILDRTTLIIYDQNGLNVYGNVSSTHAVSGYIEMDNYPVPFNAQTVYLNLYSAIRYDAFDFWNVDVDHFLANFNGERSFGFSGIADQDGAILRNISYTDFIGTLAGNADFSWDNDFSYIDLIVRLSDGRETGEHYYFQGVYDDKKIDLTAAFSDMHVNRFLRQEQEMLVNADITASWDSINLFNAQVNVSSFHTYISGNLLNAAVSVNVTNDELTLKNLRLDYDSIRAVMPQLQLNRLQGIAKANAVVESFAFNRMLDGSIEINSNFNKIDSWLDIGKAIDTFDGSLLFTNVVFGDSKYERIAFNFTRDKETLFFSGGLRNMIRLEMDSQGHFFLGLTAPFPIHGTVTGIYDKGIIDAFCHSFFIDLHQLYSITANANDFIIAGGYITGMMEFKGPFWNPELNGTGIGSSMRFQVPNFITDDLRPVPFMIHAEGHDMTFGPVVTAIGSGGGTVSGYFLFENWVPVDIGLEINVPNNNPIPYKFDVSGFLANGFASGNMNINYIMNEQMEISGDLYSNNAELGLNIDNLQMQRDPNVEIQLHSVLDLSITTGSIVEFSWPSTSPIIRVNPEMGTTIKVYYDSRAGQFSLDSDVNIRSGEIFYFDRSFYIREGTIVFKESENGFDPLISTRAEIKDRSEAGAVTISMIVENQPLLRFEPRFESNPNLTQLEIYSILGQNLNTLQGNDSADMAQRFLLTSGTEILTQIIASSNVLSQFAFFRQFERQVRDIFRLDMFSIRTRLLHNAVIYGVSGISQPTVDRGNIVGNYFDNTTVFIGKYVGRDMFVQGMLTMKYDPNSTAFGGIVFEPDIGIELQSPFLNIRWDFFPYHPENWWVSDNSITLTWSKSF